MNNELRGCIMVTQSKIREVLRIFKQYVLSCTLWYNMLLFPWVQDNSLLSEINLLGIIC